MDKQDDLDLPGEMLISPVWDKQGPGGSHQKVLTVRNLLQVAQHSLGVARKPTTPTGVSDHFSFPFFLLASPKILSHGREMGVFNWHEWIQMKPFYIYCIIRPQPPLLYKAVNT